MVDFGGKSPDAHMQCQMSPSPQFHVLLVRGAHARQPIESFYSPLSLHNQRPPTEKRPLPANLWPSQFELGVFAFAALSISRHTSCIHHHHHHHITYYICKHRLIVRGQDMVNKTVCRVSVAHITLFNFYTVWRWHATLFETCTHHTCYNNRAALFAMHMDRGT